MYLVSRKAKAVGQQHGPLSFTAITHLGKLYLAVLPTIPTGNTDGISGVVCWGVGLVLLYLFLLFFGCWLLFSM